MSSHLLVDWHGWQGKDGKYMWCMDIDDLRLCIAWLQKQLDWMESKGKFSTSVMEFSGDKDEA